MAKYVKRYREDVVVSSPLRQIYLTGRETEGVFYPQPFLLRITLIMHLLNRILCHETTTPRPVRERDFLDTFHPPSQ